MTAVYRKLYRSRQDRKLAGVCGGLGVYWGIDPTLVRLAFVLGALFWWIAPILLLYLILMVFVPLEPLSVTYA
jgi:phage shock protein C